MIPGSPNEVSYERGVSSLLHVDWLGTDALLYGRASASVSRMRRSKLSGLGCAVVPWPILGVKVGHLSAESPGLKRLGELWFLD
jgi:hypothetical protein